MSGYLGYDLQLVGGLLEAMRRAETELSGIRSNDPEGLDAMRSLAGVTTMLRDRWIPFVASLVSCQTMTGYSPATIAASDLVNSYLNSLIQRNSWRTSTDRLAAAKQPMTADQAAQLAKWLSEHDDEPNDEQFNHLQQQLAGILASPSLASVFLQNLTPNGMTGLANQLGSARADLLIMNFGGGLSDKQWARITGIDATISNLGDIIVMCSAGSPYHTSATDITSDMDPYAAALLVQHLQLGATELGSIAASLIEREQRDMFTSAAFACGVRATDILMTTILATPDGPSRFVVAVAAAPELLLSSAFDPRLANRILLDGTLPTDLSPAEQAAVIPSLIQCIEQITGRPVEPYSDDNPDIFAVAGAVIAPYILQLFVTPSNPFGISDDDSEDAWNFILDNPAMVQYFVDERDRLTLALTGPLGTDVDADMKVLTAFSELLGVLDFMYEQGRVQDAARDRAHWDLAWTMAGLVTSAIPAPGVVKGGVKLTEIGLEVLLEANGWGPAEVGQTSLDALENTDTRLAIIASVVTRSTFDGLIDQGRIPPQTTPPPIPDTEAGEVGLRYIEAMEHWVDGLEIDDGSKLWLLLASNKILSPHQASSTAARLRYSKDGDT